MPLAVFERRSYRLVRLDENLEISKSAREQHLDFVWTEKVGVLITLWKVAWSNRIGGNGGNIPCP